MVNRGRISDMEYGIEEIGDVPSPAFVMNAMPKHKIKTPGTRMI